jgi:hypothetical protein
MPGEIPDRIPGEVILASYSNDIRDRALMRYADGAARDVSNPLPAAGDLAYLTASGVYQVFDGAAWVTLSPLRAKTFGFDDDAATVTTSESVRIDMPFPQTAQGDLYVAKAVVNWVVSGTPGSTDTAIAEIQTNGGLTIGRVDTTIGGGAGSQSASVWGNRTQFGTATLQLAVRRTGTSGTLRVADCWMELEQVAAAL